MEHFDWPILDIDVAVFVAICQFPGKFSLMWGFGVIQGVGVNDSNCPALNNDYDHLMQLLFEEEFSYFNSVMTLRGM